jgi:integrase
MAERIYKRELSGGRVRYDVVIDLGPDPVTGKRRQKSQTFKTRKEAMAALHAGHVEVANGTAVSRSTKTVAQFLGYWLTDITQHRVRPTTFASYSQIIHNRIIPAIGAVSLQKLTVAQVQALYSDLLTGGRADGRGKALSPRSVQLAHTVLRKALKDAVKQGLVARNVCDAAVPPRAPRPPIDAWDTGDVRRFLDVARDDRFAALWVLAIHTGMRRGELLALRWEDIDTDKRVLYVRRSLVQSGGVMGIQEPKTASGRRTIALDVDTLSALRAHRARQVEHRLRIGPDIVADHGYVFTTDLGTPLYPSNLNRYFNNLIVKAGVPRIPFHGLRHTHATLLMKSGISPKVASERLGHAGIAITLQTYSHVLPEMQREAADVFARALSEGSK